MELIALTRPDSDRQKPLTAGEIEQIGRRAFGTSAGILSAHELGGGSFNTTYLLIFADERKMILRVAPAVEIPLFWHEEALMHRELSTLPYLAAIAPLLPKTVIADFTHQLIDRDYIIQSYIEGESWQAINHTLSPAERTSLWQQFGSLVATIHSTCGESFGLPYPGPRFPRWSTTVVYYLERILLDLEYAHHSSGLVGDEELKLFVQVSETARSSIHLLDEIDLPYLLHGDCWLFNLLIRRDGGQAEIIGVLDSDRASWGDPLYDWTMFLLDFADPDDCANFWIGYGEPVTYKPSTFRQNLYRCIYEGMIIADAIRGDNRQELARARSRLHKRSALVFEQAEKN